MDGTDLRFGDIPPIHPTVEVSSCFPHSVCPRRRRERARAFATALAETRHCSRNVVSASREPLPGARVGSAVNPSPQRSRDAATPTAVDALPNARVAIIRTAASAAREVRIRGAESTHTLVPSTASRSTIPRSAIFRFSQLLAADLERIEAARPQSSLYGSESIGGVINIITKRGERLDDSFAEVGSFPRWPRRRRALRQRDLKAAFHGTSPTAASLGRPPQRQCQSDPFRTNVFERHGHVPRRPSISVSFAGRSSKSVGHSTRSRTPSPCPANQRRLRRRRRPFLLRVRAALRRADGTIKLSTAAHQPHRFAMVDAERRARRHLSGTFVNSRGGGRSTTKRRCAEHARHRQCRAPLHLPFEQERQSVLSSSAFGYSSRRYEQDYVAKSRWRSGSAVPHRLVRFDDTISSRPHHLRTPARPPPRVGRAPSRQRRHAASNPISSSSSGAFPLHAESESESEQSSLASASRRPSGTVVPRSTHLLQQPLTDRIG